MAISQERIDFAHEARNILVHFRQFARALAKADADVDRLHGIRKMLFVHRKTNELCALRPEFTRRILGEAVQSSCERRSPRSHIQILADLDCKV